MIHRGQFREVLGEYQPLSFEAFDPEDPRFRVPMQYVLKNEERLWAAIEAASRYFPPTPFSVIDLGPYPGSLLRLLHRLLRDGGPKLLGAGLMVSDEFRQAIADDCEASILTVNLDPLNDQLRAKAYPTSIPLEDGSVEVVFALEIIEHLVSPSHLFDEAFRVCSSGGTLTVTTPNVTRIGNVLRIVRGESPYERLQPPGYVDTENEWRPHFREYTLAEIQEFFGQSGFEVVEAHTINADTSRYQVKPLKQRLIDTVKIPFYAVPHFRGRLLVVGRKPDARR